MRAKSLILAKISRNVIILSLSHTQTNTHTHTSLTLTQTLPYTHATQFSLSLTLSLPSNLSLCYTLLYNQIYHDLNKKIVNNVSINKKKVSFQPNTAHDKYIWKISRLLSIHQNIKLPQSNVAIKERWKCNFPALCQTDRPTHRQKTNQQTDIRIHGKVTLPIN